METSGFAVMIKAALSLLGPVYVVLALGVGAGMLLRVAAHCHQARRGPIKVEKKDVRYKIS